MIVLASGGIGFSYSQDLLNHTKSLKELQQMVIMIHTEIRYCTSTLPEALLGISNRVREPYSVFLYNTAMELGMLEGKTFATVWKKHVEEDLRESHLTKKDLGQLEGLGDHLGFLDKEMQEKIFVLYLEQLGQDIEESKEAAKAKTKVYHCLGVTIGLFIAIILI